MKGIAWIGFGVAVLVVLLLRQAKRRLRKSRFSRGRQLRRWAPGGGSDDDLMFGAIPVKRADATRHFLTVGTTGSGKSLVQRVLMQKVLRGIQRGSDGRALIFDAKNDMPAFLAHLGVTCPVYTLNPFDARADFPRSVAWDIAADVTSSARALNLASCLIPSEAGGANQYFTDAARQVVTSVIESLIRHAPGAWTFSDLVVACLSLDRIRLILERDADGLATLASLLQEERTAYQVFTTIVSRMAYFKPVAALWQRAESKLSLRAWLADESILLLGSNSTVKTALDAINEVVFRVLVEEIDSQSDSSTRRTWFWIDEARLSGPILRGPMLPYLCVKGRSRGACLVLAFQDIEGFREAAGPRIAHEIIAQCSYKALLRLESDESAAWASKLLGQYETLQLLRTEGLALRPTGSLSEQLTKRDAVLPSEFYLIPVTNLKHGLTGFFVGPDIGAVRASIPGPHLQAIITSSAVEEKFTFKSRAESDQWLQAWTADDERRLELDRSHERESTGGRLRWKRGTQTAKFEAHGRGRVINQ
jgi:type IV secretory pathway TraG/TraD family ATPase VirD4